MDKKHFFQELKNPPKKALNDLVLSQTPAQDNLFPASFDSSAAQAAVNNDFATDPFQDDPFDVDPFNETEFMKQDPFDSELNGDFRFITDSGKSSFVQNLSKSPKAASAVLEKQISSLRNVQFSNFDEKKLLNSAKLTQLHENPSLDLSSESECAPEPPPRPPVNNLSAIKPPPLPPKKQPGELSAKPPPRPPHSEDAHYDYMDHYETAPNSLEFIATTTSSPPLPVPARKSKFESDFTAAPERPKKQFNIQQQQEDDYLTPVSFIQPKENVTRHAGPLLLPPPQKTNRKQQQQQQQASQIALQEKEKSLDGLDITLSQLTLSGLNELAAKLHIPPSQLSNMTLVQLTSYLSNFIKSEQTSASDDVSPSFHADFAANFGNLNHSTSDSKYDRYAVFRELIQEEIKQTKIDTEPEQEDEQEPEAEHQEQTVESQESLDHALNNLDPKTDNLVVDKYAALREIVENEIKIKQNSTQDGEDMEEDEDEDNNRNEQDLALNNRSQDREVKIENEANIMNTEKSLGKSDEPEIIKTIEIEYTDKADLKVTTPVKSPVQIKTVKSPVPVAVTEVIQTNTRLNSGSLSDVISGSSPEIDNTGSTSEVAKKSTDATGKCFTIYLKFVLSK